jgi:dTDP-4-amino-4,6-dideoxy-D-galactose acyltransferase
MTMSVPRAGLCEVLEWDSHFFGCRLARFRRPRFVRDDAGALLAECEEQGIDGVYILVDAADTESIVNVQRTSAFLADVRVTFGTEVDATSDAFGEHPSARVRPAAPADVPALARIAAVSHRDTRFYADPHFDSARCDRLYSVWIENSCRGYADAVLVVENDAGGAAGYVTCHRDAAASRGHVGLFAVGEQARGRGAGAALMRAALRWFAANQIAAMTVATQLRNLPALRFYGRCGLLVRRAEMWFHLWPGDARLAPAIGRP